MFNTRTLSSLIDAEPIVAVRLGLATYLLGQMIQTGGVKEDKVRAAFEYADMLLTSVVNDMDAVAKDREWGMKPEEKE